MGAPNITGKGLGLVAASWKLALSPDQQGAAVSLDISDDGSDASWLCVVKAQTAEGEYILGAIRTRPPRSGDPKSRTVLIGWHPGARSWAVDFYGPAGATMRPVLSTSKCPGGGFFGIVPVNGSRIERRIWDPSPSQPAFAQQGILSPGPSALTKVYGFLEAAAAPGLFVGFVDSAVALVGGELFIIAPTPVPNTFPRVFSFGFDPDGLFFPTQARWVVSTSPFAVALGAGGDVAIVQSERI